MDSFYTLLENNSEYVMLITSLLTWFGIFLFLIKIEKKLSLLEKEFEKHDEK